VAKATVGFLLLVVGCGKSEKPAPRPHDAMVVIDAAPPPRFAIETKRDATVIQPHDAKCPAIELRRDVEGRGVVSIDRCRDRPLADQIPELRDMVAELRAMDPQGFERARIFGSADYYGWPELGRRYIAYAKDHPYTVKQSLHDYVLQAGASPEMWPEYAAIFQRKPRLVSVEKCSSSRATRKDIAGDFLRAEGVKGSAEIPLGCAMGVFELSR
jgi:hypothetical protein